jgi:hypothetical protein
VLAQYWVAKCDFCGAVQQLGALEKEAWAMSELAKKGWKQQAKGALKCPHCVKRG